MKPTHCRLTTWNPAFGAYTPLPDGVRVTLRTRGLLPLERGQARTRGGRVRLRLPPEEELELLLDTGGRAVDWRRVALVPAGTPGAFVPPEPWIAPLGQRRPEGGEGSEERPFELRAGREAHLRFVRWDAAAGRFAPAPAGLVVQAWDEDPWGSTALAEARTDAEGRATLFMPGAGGGAPDLHFTVGALEGTAPGLGLPWRSRERRRLHHADEHGYWEDFQGQRVGRPDSPYCFELGAPGPRTWQGNQAELLIDGPALLAAWEAAIRGARHTIHFEVMLYFDDPMTRRIQALLVQKAREGVQVRLLLGEQVTRDIASLILTEKIWARALRTLEGEALERTLAALDHEYAVESRRAAIDPLLAELDGVPNLRHIDSSFGKVEVLPGAREALPTAYRALEDQLPFFALARVDHRKLLVVDGALAILGGQNVGREYIYERPFDPATPDEQEEWPKWHDVSVCVRGPAVRELQERFRERWVSEGGDPFPFGPSADGQGTDPHHPTFPRLAPQPGGVALRVVDTTPGARFGWHEATLHALRAARREVLVTNPYFSSPEALDALCATARRGVRVALVLPDQRNDSIDFLYAARLWYSQLMAAGVEVYESGACWS